MKAFLAPLFLCLFLCICSSLQAQYIIITNGGEEIEAATIRNMGQENITYQINPGGPIYQILRKQVYRITDLATGKNILKGKEEKRTFAIGLNPAPIALKPSFAFGELEYLLSSNISIGLRIQIYSDDQLELDDIQVNSFDREDLSFSLFGRYYFNGDSESLQGFYAGLEIGVGSNEIQVDLVQQVIGSEETIRRWVGTDQGNHLLAGLQLGYKASLLNNRLFLEPAISLGGKQSSASFPYDVSVSNAFGVESAESTYEFSQLQLFAYPALTIGVLF